MAGLGGCPVPLHAVQTTAVQVCAFLAQGAPKDLGILDGARGGLILLRVSPGLAVSAERKQRTGGG